MQYDLNDNSYSGFEAGVYEELKRQFTEVTLLQQRDFHRLFRAKRMGRWYFLKALRPELQDKAIYRQMLHKEMEILKQLQHPKIVACEGIENVEVRPSDGGDPVGECIIMEYIDGLTLKEWLEETSSYKKCRRREAQNIINGILDAMSYMHASGITHRDLKPSNVMLTRNEHSVKIIDFSLSDADNYAILKQPSGTQQYMSPEQASIPIPDVRNDIYSLGVIMQQMPLGGIWKTVSKRCLLPIEQRYANIDELRGDIQRRTKRATLWRWSLMGLIASLCILSVAFFWYLSSIPYLPSDSKLVECRRRVFQVFGIGNIDFADEKVKAICIQNWDTDGDGEFNKYEAAQVMDLGEVFRDQSEIKSFDELQYFTGLNSIGNDAFNGCSNLSSLTLPFTLS